MAPCTLLRLSAGYSFLALSLFLLAMVPAAAQLEAARESSPPKTRREEVRETLHGVEIVDPFRWLEDQNSPETRAWIAAENRYADSLLDHLSARTAIAARLSQLLRVERFGMPQVRHGRLFYSRRGARDEQAILYVGDGPAAPPRIFFNPLRLSKDHSTSAGYEDITADGALAAYWIRSGGDDRVEVRIRDTRTLQDLPDRLPRDYNEGISFTRDKSGFYYNKLTPLVGRRVYYHRMGTPQSEDREVFGEGYGAEIGVGGFVSENGRWLLIQVSRGWSQNDLFVQDLQDSGPIRPIVKGIEAIFDPAFAGDTLVIRTDWKAPNRRLLAMDLPAIMAGTAAEMGAGSSAWVEAHTREIVPAGPDSLESASTVGGRVYAKYLHEVSAEIRAFTPGGRPAGDIRLPGIGDASTPSSRWDEPEAFYSFSSFTTPYTIFRYNTQSGKETIWAQPKVPFEPAGYEVRQVWFRSKDGTHVPMFLVQRKGLEWDGNRPVLLTGYGGFDASMLPGFWPSAVLWADHGGVLAVPNLRGGGEFGEAWHRAGMLANKQNVFDDFIAAAEWLIQNRVTNPNRLAISGGSNGGLLVGAALTQRPDLFRAVVCEYPLLDMLRYHKFLQGPQWVPEYGSAEDPAQFKYLLAYSPYQHVRTGVWYPSVLFITGDADTRVAPLHARKMTALLQSVESPGRPILMHYETEAGHSGGQSTSKYIQNESLIYAYLFWQLGMDTH